MRISGSGFRNRFSCSTGLTKSGIFSKIVINNTKGTGFTVFGDKAQKIIKETYETNPQKVHDLCDCFNYLVANGYRGLTLSVAEREFSINTASDLKEAESFFN